MATSLFFYSSELKPKHHSSFIQVSFNRNISRSSLEWDQKATSIVCFQVISNGNTNLPLLEEAQMAAFSSLKWVQMATSFCLHSNELKWPHRSSFTWVTESVCFHSSELNWQQLYSFTKASLNCNNILISLKRVQSLTLLSSPIWAQMSKSSFLHPS